MAGLSGEKILRVLIAGESSRLPWQIFLAGYFGGLFQRVILAHLFGGFSQLVKQAGFLRKRKAREKEEKCILSRPVNCSIIIVCSQ
jgi:hypothetical protein